MVNHIEFLNKAKSVVGSKYWYACSGQKPTSEKLESLIHGQFSKKWTQERIKKARSEIGKCDHVFDCIGLVRWCSGMEKNVNALNTNADRLKELSHAKPLSCLPEIPGICLFMSGHVGIYAGNQRVIECWGFRQVDEHPVSFQKWTHWGKIPWVEYPDSANKKECSFETGKSVKVKDDSVYYESGIKMASFVPGNTYHISKTAIRSGKTCVLLEEINTWCDIQNLEIR